MSTANRLVLSFPADLSDWGRDQLDTRHFRAYLRRVHGTAQSAASERANGEEQPVSRDAVSVGDEWPVFLDVGCCGDSLDLTLRVEDVDGDELDEETTIEYVERAAEGIEGGWRVQSRGAPERD